MKDRSKYSSKRSKYTFSIGVAGEVSEKGVQISLEPAVFQIVGHVVGARTLPTVCVARR